MRKISLALCLALALGCAFINASGAEYVFLRKGAVLSYAIGDADGDGKDELVAILRRTPRRTTAEGEEYGGDLYLLEYGGSVFGFKKVIRRYDISKFRPMKVMLGDVDGDGSVDISVMVCKETEFHPVMAKRPFFFNVKDGALNPLWLGSRLSRPFLDYILHDIDGDGVCEIISAEYLADGSMTAAVYKWAGFGFEKIAESGIYAEIKAVFADENGDLTITTDSGNEKPVFR